MKKKICVILILIAAIAVFAPSKGNAYDQLFQWFEANADVGQDTTETEADALYSVVKVKDGDTIVVSLNGTETTVRLIGVNTPESVSPDESQNCENGKIASEWLKTLLSNKKVRLEYDEGLTDTYGRTLAYVYLDENMVNRLLLQNGYATVMTVRPNVKYETVFLGDERDARRAGLGFWNH